MSSSIYFLLWSKLSDYTFARTSSDLHNALRGKGFTLGQVRLALDDMLDAGLTDESGDAWYRAAKWESTPMHAASPTQIKKGTAEWGCWVTGTIAVGDLVAITTRGGENFQPAVITEVVRDYTLGSNREQAKVCRIERNPKLYKSSQKPQPEVKKSPIPSPAPQPSTKQDAGQVAMLLDFVRQAVAKEVDAKTQSNDALLEQIKKEVEARVKPMIIEVKQPDKPSVKVEGAHYLFPRLLRLVSAGFNVFMWGPPGTGKTTAALQVATALSRKAEIDTLDPTTARSMVQGYMTPNGDPVHNVFTRCWENGSVYVADEVDLAPGHVQTLFNSALANGHAPLAWGNVQKADGFSFVATGNTAGRPTAAFPDRRPMSNAFADRLYFMHWPLDPGIECRAVGLPTPSLPAEDKEECSPQNWVKFVRSMRDWAINNAPTLSITPRASLLGIQALAAGESPNNVADGLIFRGCDPDLRKKALRNVKW